MINRIDLKEAHQFLLQTPGGTGWHVCTESNVQSRPYIVRTLNEFENNFINLAIDATVQKAWVWAGGNPEIHATQEELRFALETLDQIAEEADESTNPLLVFAKEVLIGAYKPEELSGAATKAINYFRNIK